MAVLHVVDVLVVRRPDDDDAAAHVEDVDVCPVEAGERPEVSTSSGVPMAQEPGAR